MQKIKGITRLIGIIIILFSLFFNPFIVENLFSSDKNLENVFRVILFEVILFLFGLFIFLKASWISSRRKEILLFLAVFFILFSILEAGYRIMDRKPKLFTAHPYLNYYGTPNYVSLDGLNRHNSLGFRGEEIEVPKPKSTYRIVLIGESSTYEEQVKDWKKDWARGLEKELREMYSYDGIEVINAGIPGWTTWESLINLEFKVVYLNPDLIIIYHGTNDVLSRLVPPSHYFSDNTGRRKQWEQKSCIYPFCSKVIQKLLKRERDDFDVDASTAGKALDPGYDKVLGMTPLEAYENNKPIYFEINLRNMIAIAREQGIDVLLSTWAYSDQFDPATDYTASYHSWFGFNQNNEVVKNVGKNKGVPVYDFASEIPKDKEFWADGRHANERGVKLKSELFANYIYQNKIIENRIKELKNAEK